MLQPNSTSAQRSRSLLPLTPRNPTNKAEARAAHFTMVHSRLPLASAEHSIPALTSCAGHRGVLRDRRYKVTRRG